MSEFPDFFTELIAWRKFAVKDSGRLLVSANIAIPWATVDPGPATCIQPVHPLDEPCPSLKCHCGYYAYKTKDDAIAHAQGYVLGRVLVWGRVAQHVRGYRAARMKLVELFVPPDYPSAGRDGLIARYQIPVTLDGGIAWTSENPNASLSLSQLANQYLSQQNNPYSRRLSSQQALAYQQQYVAQQQASQLRPPVPTGTPDKKAFEAMKKWLLNSQGSY